MKKLFLALLAMGLAAGVQAQKSALFTYDSRQVEMALQTVGEYSQSIDYEEVLLPDTTVAAGGGSPKYFWKGALIGGLGCTGGVLAAWLTAEVFELGITAAYVSMIAGAAVGLVVPEIIAYQRTHDPKAAGRAFLGGTASLAAGALIFVLLMQLD